MFSGKWFSDLCPDIEKNRTMFWEQTASRNLRNCFKVQMLSNWNPWGLLTPNNYILLLLKMFILWKLEITSKETSSREMQGQLTETRWTRLGKNIIISAKFSPLEFFANFALSSPKLQPLQSLRMKTRIPLFNLLCNWIPLW